MTDLVSRLRERHSFLCDEAAEEIERLRGLLHDWREQWGDGMHPDGDLIDATDAALAGAAVQPIAVTGNCGLCGQPRADHAEVAPDGKPECRMKENSHHG